MTNFIPIFPLSVVVYPGEELKLHIFEPRYKQLIRECVDAKKNFGIPAMINDKLEEFGTLMSVSAVEKEYENGELDIRTRGLQVFRLLEVIREVPDKLYAGAIVNYPENREDHHPVLMKKVLAAIRQLHDVLKVSKAFSKPDGELAAYDVAHHAGLSLQQEYEVLQLLDELHRLEYLKRHLKKVIPLMSEMENLRERVKLNGHFRNLGTGSF